VNTPVNTPVETPDIIKDKSKSKSKKKNTTCSKKKDFKPPTLGEVREYIKDKGLTVDADFFFEYYSTAEWRDKVGNPISSWKLKCLTWSRRDSKNKSNNTVLAKTGTEVDWSKYDG
jgi:hypothetical protein